MALTLPMTYGVLVKPGVAFTCIAKAGARILGALDQTARRLSLDLTITSACDGHELPDPHSCGEAYDVRTHGMTWPQKSTLLRELMLDLVEGDQDAPVQTSGGLATAHFFGWIEHPGDVDEHLHVQRRKDTVYT